MQTLYFYGVYALFLTISSLPFFALYALSDFCYYILWISGYRKDVVRQNLRNSFPEKTEKEIESLTRNYYWYLCDLVVETIKTLKMPEHEVRKRVSYHTADFMERFRAEKRSIILVLGHYGNWEWAGPAFTLNSGFQLVVVYRPLSSVPFEKIMVSMRTRFGTRITPVAQTLRDMVANRNLLTSTAFIADQSAPADKSYWMNFLHQDTAVFTGFEKLAAKFDYPVVYLKISRPQRGYYDLHFELISENPSREPENAIAHAFMTRLERDINNDPVPWLWSHKRWKYKRPPVE